MKKICAITGANGYVGGCIKNYFAARGWDMFELVRRPKPGSRSFQFQLGDDLSPDLLSGVNTLVHCAYDFTPLTWNEITAINVEGSRKILQAARAAKVAKIIFISSISAYDDCRSMYGKAKLEIEKIALANGAMVIRPGLVYGGPSGGMFGKLAEKTQKSSIMPMIGSGSQIQFLVHQEDLCSFAERYASGAIDIAPRILTAANERPWPLKELILTIAQSNGKKPTFVPIPWQLVWMGIKSAEMCGLRLNFRSDSLVSLIYQNSKPDFSPNAGAGLVCRPLDVTALKG
jgi:nucleoside-diphosphate-sugar epimerase